MGRPDIPAHYSDECSIPQGSQDPPDHESSGLLDELHLKGRFKRDTAWQTNPYLFTITLINMVLFTVSAILLGSWYHEKYFTRNPELRRVSIYSPVFDALDLGLHTIQINGTLFPPEQPTIARQMPNPAADKVWHDYEKVRPIPLTKSQIIRIGKDPATVAKFDDKIWGLGDDAYVADLDVFHQLHCLNTLRSLAYANYYNRTALDASDDRSLNAVHINHCVDMLMTAIQCSGNVGFITSNWVEGVRFPQPDMSVNRKCIDFNRLVEWRNAHSVDLDKYQRVMATP